MPGNKSAGGGWFCYDEPITIYLYICSNLQVGVALLKFRTHKFNAFQGLRHHCLSSLPPSQVISPEAFKGQFHAAFPPDLLQHVKTIGRYKTIGERRHIYAASQHI